MSAQYSVKVGNGMTLAEVVKLCREVAPFLINQFLAGADMDVVHWPDTFFYKWIKKENPVGSAFHLHFAWTMLTLYRCIGARLRREFVTQRQPR